MVSYAPTDEQTQILTAAKSTSDNIMLNALAGTGKTSTLEMLEGVVKQKPILYLVFNKRNADEAKERMLGTTSVKTFNALGHGIWASVIGRSPSVDTKKTYNIFKGICDEVKGSEARTLWSAYDLVKSGVEMAKAIGYVPTGSPNNTRGLASKDALNSTLDEEPDDLVSDLIDAVLRQSIRQSYEGCIDYNDQVYMSALFGGTYPKFPLTLVDEYQDLNAVNHEMIRRLVGDRRLIGVGDPWQNIYGFRGAKHGGMNDAVTAYTMQTRDLSISFRCPEAIVRNARWHVPHFRWFNTGGEVGCRDYFNASDFEPNSTFICRNNAPLLGLAFKLIGAGHGINLIGSDIGPRLVTTLKKLGPGELTQGQALLAVDEWLGTKLDKGSKTAPDMAECMKIIIRQSASLSTAVGYAEHLFKQRGAIQLMTGHKSKGLEFPLVYHLDPHIIGNGQQDRNIRYVIQTRSSDRYYEIDSATINWSK
jgi:DNA helicase II / ATP-dependent DNA helicase PcrA